MQIFANRIILALESLVFIFAYLVSFYNTQKYLFSGYF